MMYIAFLHHVSFYFFLLFFSFLGSPLEGEHREQKDFIVIGCW